MTRTTPLALVALLLAGGAPTSPLAAATPPGDKPAQEERFEDQVVVREVEVRFDLSVLPRFESLGKKGPGDFVLLEDGAARPTLGFEAEPERDGWEIVIWFDDGLADAAARALAARRLAERAARLVAAGPVEVVEAGEAISTAATFGSAPGLSDRLLEIAARAEAGPAAAAIDLERAAARLDRLAVVLAERKGGGDRTLLLPLSSWQIDAQVLDEIGRARSGDEATPRARPLVEAARALAGYGWVTLGVALQPAAPAAPVAPKGSPTDGTVTVGGAGDEQVSAPLRLPGRQGEAKNATAARLDSAVDLGRIPGADLVRPGSGALASHSEQLDELLDRLFARARLVAAAPEAPPGRMLARRVIWAGGDERPLPTVSLSRSSTPPEIAAARLRRALSGAAAGALDPGLVLDRSGTAPRVCLAEGVDAGWVRLSSARLESGEARLAIGEPIELRRPAAEGGAVAPAVAACAAWPATAAGDTVHLVDDLTRESWTTF